MPFDAAPAACPRDVLPFRPYAPPLRIVWSDDDEGTLAALELGWENLRGAIAPEDDGSEPIDDSPPPPRRSARRGITVAEAADALSIPPAAFVALCDHHSILILRRHGDQQRRFVTPSAKRDGFGWNVSPRTSPGAPRVPFPVFDPLCLEGIAMTLGWPDIKTAVAHLPTSEAQRAFLLTHHAYLPDAVIGGLSGYARSTVQKARRALATH